MKHKPHCLLLVIIVNAVLVIAFNKDSLIDVMLNDDKSVYNVNSKYRCGCREGWLTNVDVLFGEALVKIRRRFEVQIHFDDSSSCLVNCLLRNSHDFIEKVLRKNLTLLKHDYLFCNEFYTKDESGNTLKPVTINSCSKSKGRGNICKRTRARAVAHLILFDNPWDFETCCGSTLDILNQDILIIASKEFPKYRLSFKTISGRIPYNADYLESFWNQKNMDSSGSVYILEVTKTFIEYYRVCYYCGQYSKTLIKQWSKSHAEIPEIDNEEEFYLCPWPFNDFVGHVFRVGFNYGKMHFHFNKSTMHIDERGLEAIQCNPCLGPEGLLIVEMAKRLNFQFNLYHPTLNDTTKIAPSDLIIKYILNGDLDWGISGITYTVNRRKNVDFLSPLLNDPYTLLYYTRENNWERIKRISRPFDVTVWMMISLSVILIWICMKAKAKLYNYNKKSRKQLKLLNFIGLLLEHPLIGFISPQIRLQVTMWFLLTFTLGVMYKTRLASMAIKPSDLKDMSLDYISDHGYEFLISSNSSIFGISMLKSSSDKRMINFYRNARHDMGSCRSLRYMMTNNAVIFDENILLAINYLTRCPAETKDDAKNFHFYPKVIFDSYQSWPLRLNSPFQGAFNRIIGRLMQSGILQKWIKDAVMTKKMFDFIYDTHHPSSAKALQLNDVYGAFCVLLIGFFLSITWFLVEVFISKGR